MCGCRRVSFRNFGATSSTALLGHAGRSVKTSRRYAHGSMSWSLQLAMRVVAMAFHSAPSSLPQNVQFALLCGGPVTAEDRTAAARANGFCWMSGNRRC